jgi:hypothetical protein
VADDLSRINKKIFEAIQNHPSMKGLSKRTIYNRIAETRKQIGTWHSKRAAAAYLASTLGIDVYKLYENILSNLKSYGKSALYQA